MNNGGRSHDYSRPILALAHVASSLGHPFVVSSAFLIFLARRQASTGITVAQASVTIAVMIVPLALWNLRQVRSGAYANFDVSVPRERDSMYIVAVGLMLVGTMVTMMSGASHGMRVGTMVMLAMFACAGIVNRRVKVSLHTAVALYLSLVMMTIDWRLGSAFLIGSVIVAMSRWVLGRHTPLELTLGGLLGTGAGVVWMLI